MQPHTRRLTHLILATVGLLALWPRHTVAAQTREIDSLVAHALSVSPTVSAAAARVAAAQRRVGPAGLWADPMLMFGLVNLPLGAEAGMTGPDPMTMRMVGLEQTIPYPGKSRLRRSVMQRDVDATRAALDGAKLRVTRDVKDAYFELAFIHQALQIVERNQDLLTALIRAAEARYGAGTAGQQDVLKARLEAVRLAETAASLSEQRLATVARLSATLNQPSGTAIEHPVMPPAIAAAAVTQSADDVRFVSAALGARAADSPLPSLSELQDGAVLHNAELREQDNMIASQVARVELSRREYLPDFDVSLQYGQRGGGRPDMVSATVSLPLPVYKKRKQDQLVAEAGAQVAALQAERLAMANEVRADVARLVTEIERARTHLALYLRAILPQGRATLASATASYQVGKVEFLSVLDSQALLFSYETEYFRSLSDFARNLAELERVTGKEIIR